MQIQKNVSVYILEFLPSYICATPDAFVLTTVHVPSVYDIMMTARKRRGVLNHW